MRLDAKHPLAARATSAAKGPTPAQRATHERVVSTLQAEGYIAATSPSGYLRERFEAYQCALTQPCVVRVEEPGELTSWANRRGVSIEAAHAAKRSAKSKREMGERFARKFGDLKNHLRDLPAAFAVVVITRIAPRRLDTDNAESAAKAVRDGIAAGLGIDDRSSLVRYVVSQEQGEPRQHLVRAELFIAGGALTRNEVHAAPQENTQ